MKRTKHHRKTLMSRLPGSKGHHAPEKTKISEAITISFTFELGDYCSFTINESTGSFLVDGDAFTGSYGWNIGSNLGGEPPYTLLKGLDGFGVDYLAGKLSRGSGSTYDEAKTEEAVREYAKEIGREDDEELDDIDFCSIDAFYYSIPTWVEEAHEMVVFSQSRADRILRERYLPAFKAWARQRVLDSSQSPGQVG